MFAPKSDLVVELTYNNIASNTLAKDMYPIKDEQLTTSSGVLEPPVICSCVAEIIETEGKGTTYILIMLHRFNS